MHSGEVAFADILQHFSVNLPQGVTHEPEGITLGQQGEKFMLLGLEVQHLWLRTSEDITCSRYYKPYTAFVVNIIYISSTALKT